MWRLLRKLRDNRPVGELEAQHYDRGNDDKHYVSASYRSTSDPDFELAILLPLLYESQLMILVDPYAKNLADSIISSLARYKSGTPLSTILPINSPTANVPLVLSSTVVLSKTKSRNEYFVDFLPEFRVSGVKDAMIARFLWVLLPWAFSQLGETKYLTFVLAHLDLVSNLMSARPRTASQRPLLRSDAQDLISGLGWTIPEITKVGAFLTSTSESTLDIPNDAKQLEFWLRRFESHVGRAMAYVSQAAKPHLPDPFDPSYNVAKTQQTLNWSIGFQRAYLEVQAARESLEHANDTWPQGKAALKELDAGTDELVKLIENYQRINSLLRSYEPFSTTSRIRPLILQNRQYAANADRHFRNGLSELEEVIGIKIDISV